MNALYGIGGDGGSIMDCPAYQYALGLSSLQGAPVGMVPCVLDGEPRVYACAYKGDRKFNRWAHSPNGMIRAGVALACMVRARAEVEAVIDDANHPARNERHNK